MGPGGFPIPGGAATYRAAPTAEYGCKLGVHLGGGGERGGGVLANGNLHLVKAEYGCGIYCNANNYGTMRGGGEEARGTDGDAVVGTGRN